MVRGLESSVGVAKFLRFEDGLGAAPYELGPAGSEVGGDGVESFDEVVIELDEYFATGHDHMVQHMVRWSQA